MTEFPVSRYCWSHISYVASDYPMKNRLRFTPTPYMQCASIDIRRSNSAETGQSTNSIVPPHSSTPIPKKLRQTHQQNNPPTQEISAPMGAQRLRFLKSGPQRPPTIYKPCTILTATKKKPLKPLDRCKDLRLLETQP